MADDRERRTRDLCALKKKAGILAETSYDPATGKDSIWIYDLVEFERVHGPFTDEFLSHATVLG